MVLRVHVSVVGLAVARYVAPPPELGLVVLGSLSAVAVAFD